MERGVLNDGQLEVDVSDEHETPRTVYTIERSGSTWFIRADHSVLHPGHAIKQFDDYESAEQWARDQATRWERYANRARRRGKCATCLHWRPEFRHDGSEVASGECHRRAPANVTTRGVAVWPITTRHQSCSEYEFGHG